MVLLQFEPAARQEFDELVGGERGGGRGRRLGEPSGFIFHKIFELFGGEHFGLHVLLADFEQNFGEDRRVALEEGGVLEHELAEADGLGPLVAEVAEQFGSGGLGRAGLTAGSLSA